MNKCISAIVLLVAIVIGIYYYVALTHKRFAGLLPAFHIGIPWGLTEEELASIDDFAEKTVVVTGANAGIGKWTAALLADMDANVIMGCRSLAKCDKAVEEIRSFTKRGELQTKTLDLASFHSTRDFAKAISESQVASLILNAGYLPGKREISIDNIEKSFQTNHLGGFFLYKKLEEKLLAAGKSSVVFVSSGAHLDPLEFPAGVPLNRAELDDLRDNDEKFDSKLVYGAGKLANILMAKELSKRMLTKGICGIAPHPGGVASEFINRATEFGPPQTKFSKFYTETIPKILRFAWTPRQAALTSIAAALRCEQFPGSYMVPVARPFEPSEQAQNPESAKKLWEFSEEVVPKS